MSKRTARAGVFLIRFFFFFFQMLIVEDPRPAPLVLCASSLSLRSFHWVIRHETLTAVMLGIEVDCRVMTGVFGSRFASRLLGPNSFPTRMTFF